MVRDSFFVSYVKCLGTRYVRVRPFFIVRQRLLTREPDKARDQHNDNTKIDVISSLRFSFFYRFMFPRGIGVTLAYHRIRQVLSHTCHTEIDQTGIFMRIYTNVEIWCGSHKQAVLLEKQW